MRLIFCAFPGSNVEISPLRSVVKHLKRTIGGVDNRYKYKKLVFMKYKSKN